MTYFLKQQSHFREKWVHEIFLERDSKSEFTLAEDLLDKGDPEKCYQYFMMSSTLFYTIVVGLQLKEKPKENVEKYMKKITAVLFEHL